MAHATSYLELEAAKLGDCELQSLSVRMPCHVLEEVEYAGDLFQRAQEAIDQELAVLEAAGVKIPGYGRLRVSLGLNQLTAELRFQAMLARAGRAL